MIRMGLPKGVVKQRSFQLIESYLGHGVNRQQLWFTDGKDMSFYLLKHRDIPRLIASGQLDCGITSTEWIEEFELSFETIAELDWCDTRISVISPEAAPALEKNELTCITEFPRIANKYFSRFPSKRVKIESVSGSSEALVPSLYDCCVDCIETGATLAHNNLREEAVIYRSKVVFVSNRRQAGNLNDFVHILKKLEMTNEETVTYGV
ncbi:ATP phosphoribosyltransferase [Paenibacillus chitinolyticus]|uniref:ATP phosphoribosyltransferase n=1 Tax=Paenibacillus chitinolyticus TaxID=79263 RepID=UPI0036D7C90B